MSIPSQSESFAKLIERLNAENKKMREVMQLFCDRVDAGEVRSTKTYNQFKAILNDGGE